MEPFSDVNFFFFLIKLFECEFILTGDLLIFIVKIWEFKGMMI